MKIICISDLHGYLPEVPDCDLLLLAGDYCPTKRQNQAWWFAVVFAPWLKELSSRMKVVGIAGNHDWVFQDAPHSMEHLPWTYLQDSGCEFDGLRIWGSPWQLPFCDWAFNLAEPMLSEKWRQIPSDTDILITHGPPLGFGDYVKSGGHVGSRSLLEAVKHRIEPRLHVFGHIHEGYGMYHCNNTTMFNASYVDERYRPVNSMLTISF